MADKVTKKDIAEVIAESADISKNKAGDCLNDLLDYITENLEKGKKVGLTGFGTFSITRRKARKGRNPQTGETIQIPARNAVKFKTGKNLKESVQ